jgi:branched-chain amino acid transport system permease protein
MKFRLLVITLICLFFLPLFVNRPYFLHVLILIFVFATLGTAWNLLAGYGGQISLGHNVFFGIGAYTSALLIYYFQLNHWHTLLFSGIFATLIAIPLIVCFRLRGAYFALATLAFAEIVRLSIMNSEFTRGAAGVTIPIPSPIHIGNLVIDFTSKIPFYYFSLLIFSLTTLFIYFLVNSKFGLKLLAIRENEDTAQACGIHVFKLKTFALLISAFFAGIIGGFYANYISYIDPSAEVGGVLSPYLGLDAILVSLMGGLGMLAGPFVGSIIKVGGSEILRVVFGFIKGLDILVFGGILVLIVLFAPKGILGHLRGVKNEYFARSSKTNKIFQWFKSS